MCAAFAVICRNLFASQPFVIIINIENRKLMDEKTQSQAPFALFLRSNVKTEASYPIGKIQSWEIVEMWHTPFKPPRLPIVYLTVLVRVRPLPPSLLPAVFCSCPRSRPRGFTFAGHATRGQRSPVSAQRLRGTRGLGNLLQGRVFYVCVQGFMCS